MEVDVNSETRSGMCSVKGDACCVVSHDLSSDSLILGSTVLVAFSALFACTQQMRGGSAAATSSLTRAESTIADTIEIIQVRSSSRSW